MYIFWEGYRDSLKDTMWVKSKYWALVDTCILMHCILSIKGILFHISFNLTNSSIPAALTHMGVTISMRVVAVLNQQPSYISIHDTFIPLIRNSKKERRRLLSLKCIEDLSSKKSFNPLNISRYYDFFVNLKRQLSPSGSTDPAMKIVVRVGWHLSNQKCR